MRYIRAGGCSTYGLLSLFLMFAVTCAVILLSNWWLGRWSNAERTRYASTVPCPSVQHSKISNMTTDEWFEQRDRFFYVLLGTREDTEKNKNNICLFLGLSLLSVLLLFFRTFAYFISCHLTARSLHNQMFDALLRAPVLFFDSNPIGEIPVIDGHQLYSYSRPCGQSFLSRHLLHRRTAIRSEVQFRRRNPTPWHDQPLIG
jgi:ABC-type multidrug transport system fused ATPase/permease subunit